LPAKLLPDITFRAPNSSEIVNPLPRRQTTRQGSAVAVAAAVSSLDAHP